MQVQVDGYPVYVAASEPSAPIHLPRIVFIHGAQNDHRVWAAQLSWFAAQGFAVFAPDFPGHGQSSGPLLPNIELMGQWLGRFISAIFPFRDSESSPVVLVGHSMGSLAALECTSNQHERIAALVMVGTAFPMKVSPGLLEQTRIDEAVAIGQIAQWSYAPDLPDADELARDLRRERIVFATQLMKSQLPGVLHSDLNACNTYQRGLECAEMVRCPSLVIAGSKDHMTPPKFALGLQQKLGAEFQTIDGAGHSMMGEQSLVFCETVLNFLNKLNYSHSGLIKT